MLTADQKGFLRDDTKAGPKKDDTHDTAHRQIRLIGTHLITSPMKS